MWRVSKFVLVGLGVLLLSLLDCGYQAMTLANAWDEEDDEDE
jgi:hypothetical protein